MASVGATRSTWVSTCAEGRARADDAGVAMQRLDLLLGGTDLSLQLVLQPVHFVERLPEALLAALARERVRKEVRHQPQPGDLVIGPVPLLL